jgi:hypothetical protein
MDDFSHCHLGAPVDSVYPGFALRYSGSAIASRGLSLIPNLNRRNFCQPDASDMVISCQGLLRPHFLFLHTTGNYELGAEVVF